MGITTHGSCDSLSNESDYRTNMYYPVLDCITGEMESRFNDLGKSLIRLYNHAHQNQSFI